MKNHVLLNLENYFHLNIALPKNIDKLITFNSLRLIFLISRPCLFNIALLEAQA